eukprot:COSAG05_NODE_1530_length_4621_cov_3.869084_2_plen_480_part_00
MGPENAGALEKTIPKDCDLYVVGIQEGQGDAFFGAFEAHVAKFGCICLSTEGNAVGKKSKVKGRGDGSMVKQKVTSMRVYCKESIQDDVNVYSHWSQSFGKKEGSKGANGVGLRVFDTTLALVNCHMAASIGKAGALSKRADQYARVVDVLGNKLGNEFFQLNSQFHHVIWMGDMNYRLTGIEMPQAVKLIKEGKSAELFEYDELSSQQAAGNIFGGYVEPEMDFANFDPSYKKDKRRTVEDKSDPDWVEKTYMVDYKQQWYKGGRTKTRCPAWCDRILFHSHRDRAENISMSDYRATTDCFYTSDHSPVSCVATLQVKNLPALPVSMYKLRLFNCKVLKADGQPCEQRAKHIKVVAPAPFEVTDRPPLAKKLEIEQIEPGKQGATFFFVGMGLPLHAAGCFHHFLAKVTIGPQLKGEVVVGLKLSDFVDSKTISFTEPIEYDGVPLTGSDGQPLVLVFDTELFCPANPGSVEPEPEPE